MAGKSIGSFEGTGVSKFLPAGAGGTGTGQGQLEIILSTVIGFLTIVAGIAFLIYFLLGALTWILAGGDEKKVEDAKSYMTNGAVGLIIVVASYSIASIVGTVLGLQILNPAAAITNIIGK